MNKPIFSEEPFCEHCMDLEAFDMVFDDDGVTWCRWCFDFKDGVISDDWIKQEKKLKVEYFKKRLQALESE